MFESGQNSCSLSEQTKSISRQLGRNRCDKRVLSDHNRKISTILNEVKLRKRLAEQLTTKRENLLQRIHDLHKNQTKEDLEQENYIDQLSSNIINLREQNEALLSENGQLEEVIPKMARNSEILKKRREVSEELLGVIKHDFEQDYHEMVDIGDRLNQSLTKMQWANEWREDGLDEVILAKLTRIKELKSQLNRLVKL